MEFDVSTVTTGMIFAMLTATPLDSEFDWTTAVSDPAAAGFVVKVTVSDVAEAEVTVPSAPLLKVTMLLAAIESNPTPLIVTEVAFAATVGVPLVTTGNTVATGTAAPLLTPLLVTIAVSSTGDVGFVLKVTVSRVVVAAVTVPAAPLLNTTVLLAAEVSNPNPLMDRVVASASRLEVLLVTTGTTVETCTAAPLLRLLVVTIAVRLPAEVGAVVRLTVSVVAVAAVTVPTAPLLKLTVLLAAVVENPTPVIVRLLAFAERRAVVFVVTTGLTSAIKTAELPTMLLEVIDAVRFPAAAGLVENVTVSNVAVAAVTTPAAPLLKVTTFLLGTV